MEPQSPRFPAGQWKRSTTRRFLRWFFSWQVQRKLLFFGVTVVTLVALFVGVENWRGRRAWQHYASELKARGKPLALTEIIPPPVPDDENFVATPYWKELTFVKPLDGQPDTNRWPLDASLAERKGMRMRVSSKEGSKPYHYLKLTDLPALAAAFRQLEQKETVPDPTLASPLDAAARRSSAEEVLAALRVYDSVIEEFRQASQRPKARFPIQYDLDNPAGILLPQLAVLKGKVQTLKTKAVAELAAGHSEQAWQDVNLLFRLADAVKDEPLLISYLVRLACLQITVSAIWEGMAFDSWTASQLESLQTTLQSYDLIADTETALTGERTCGNAMFDYLARVKNQAGEAADVIGDPNNRPLSLVLLVVPRGWFYFEKVNYNRLFDDYVDLQEPPGDPRISPSKCQSMEDDLESLLHASNPVMTVLKHRVFASLMLPALGRVAMKAARAQAFMEMATLACALERFRMARGGFPNSLDELTPDFAPRIPNDVVSDQPYRYQREGEQGFRLYSVGWNQKDDGGREERENEGDWVWRSLEP